MVGWLVDLLVGWLFGWLVGYVFGWLVFEPILEFDHQFERDDKKAEPVVV